MNERRETLGEFMKRWRYCQGWTQAKTAKMLNISMYYYNMLENANGKRKYHSPRLLKKLSDLTGATVSFLMALPIKRGENENNK